MDMAQAEQIFIEEAQDLLQVMETCLLDIESGDATPDDHIAAIFRAAHTIKGSAGLFGFNTVVGFTHSVESVLDKVRDHQLQMDAALVSLLLDCQQHMAQMVAALSDPGQVVNVAQGTALLEQLGAYLQPAKTVAAVQAEAAQPAAADAWRIDVAYGVDVFRDGMDPVSQLSYLSTLGTLEDVVLLTDFPADFDPESCYLQLQLLLKTDASKQKIEDVFEFIRESSQVQIQPPLTVVDQLAHTPLQPEKLGQLLVDAGAVTPRELEQVLELQKQQTHSSVGELLVQQGAVPSAVVEAAVNRQAHQEHKRASDFQVLKVEARKLDHLIKLIGEMVTAGSANEVLISQTNNEQLQEAFSSITHLIEQIRDGALSLRMVQIGESFSRLKRIVRDVSRELGKDVELEVLGAETELDKSMVEKLSDPLMHIVRNALDHGIEPVDIRTYRGKPAQGRLKLAAYHEAGAVVIEIQDDGAGLDASRIRAKAEEKGLISSDQVLSQEDVYRLIFEPGFSTAAQVTNLSGRGVGMDVVKRNIEELRGQILIDSELGKGTRFRIRLPLTLAIIDGFEVTVGDTHLVLPVNMIQECLEFEQAELVTDRNYLNLRGDVLPFVRLRQLFQLTQPASSRENIVVVQYGRSRAGLVVDTLNGELQAVIKPLAPIFRSTHGISGSTILGSGDVGFILDIPQLIEYACSAETEQVSGAPEQGDNR